LNSPSRPNPPRHWLIVALLLLSVAINYIDRGSLSVAAPRLSKEFDLGPRQLGSLLAAFFWSYTLCQLVVGALVDRWEVKWIYAGGFLVWSLAMAATGMVSGFTALFAARLVLGIGESVFLPAVSKIVVRLFPAERRGLPNALVDVGTKVGPALSILIGGLLLEHYGWRALFIGIGLASLLWLLPWIALVPRSPGAPADDKDLALGSASEAALNGPGLCKILSRRELWGTSLGMFALGYVWIFLLTWLPSYLVNERGYTTKQMAVFGSLPYWGMAATSLAGGWASDRWIASGGAPSLVRKTFAGTGLFLCAALLLPAGFVADNSVSMVFLITACVALGLFTSNVWAITQTLAGTGAAGKWTGIQNFIGNLGGVISPIIAGVIVERTGRFYLAFAAAAGVLVLGGGAYVAMIKKVEALEWSGKT
jgi:MFS family permease